MYDFQLCFNKSGKNKTQFILQYPLVQPNLISQCGTQNKEEVKRENTVFINGCSERSTKEIRYIMSQLG